MKTGDELGNWLVPERRTRPFYRPSQKGIEPLTGAKLAEINEKGLEIVALQGRNRLIQTDHTIPTLLALVFHLPRHRCRGR